MFHLFYAIFETELQEYVSTAFKLTWQILKQGIHKILREIEKEKKVGEREEMRSTNKDIQTRLISIESKPIKL